MEGAGLPDSSVVTPCCQCRGREFDPWSLKQIPRVKVLATQSCPTLCDPMDGGLPGSSVRGIFEARILEWVAISFSRGSFYPTWWGGLYPPMPFTSEPLRRLHSSAHVPAGVSSPLEERTACQLVPASLLPAHPPSSPRSERRQSDCHLFLHSKPSVEG